MPTAGNIRVGPGTRRLADEMKRANQTMQTIIDETLESASGAGPALESGRTACGSASNLRKPLNRFPRAVDLSSCPVDKTGLWHTHPSRDELRSPRLSIPDMGLVVFEGVDVHAVVGTERGEMMLAPDDRNRLQEEFAQAIGVDAQSSADIMRAAATGSIDPESAARRVRERLPHLFTRFSTNVRLARESLPVESLPAHAPLRACAQHASGPDAGRIRERSRKCTNGLRATASDSQIDLRELVLSQTLGTIAGAIANEVFVKRVFGIEA